MKKRREGGEYEGREKGRGAGGGRKLREVDGEWSREGNVENTREGRR